MDKLKIFGIFGNLGPMITKEDFNKTLISQHHCILGKNGITDEFIEHILSLLKRHNIIKIKALKSIAIKSNIHAIAEELAQKSRSYLLDVRGKKIILSKYPFDK